MSDAPDNPDRRWFSGLRPTDWVAFVQCRVEPDGSVIPAQSIEVFQVDDLFVCEDGTRLGPPKSSSEGSERDREWPSTVPKFNGEVLSVDENCIRTQLDTGRKQTYQLRGKTAYVNAGDTFRAAEEFIAGLPSQKIDLTPSAENWNPRGLLDSENPIDRYAACKVLGHVGTNEDIDALMEIAGSDAEERVRLEAAASAAKLGSEDGFALLLSILNDPPVDYLQMEVVLILPELKGTPLAENAAAELRRCASNSEFEGAELRQAAIWGLGKTGLQSYESLLDLLDLNDENERIHAIAAFGETLDSETALALVNTLIGNGSAVAKASACYILAKASIESSAAQRLVEIASADENGGRAWALATLGQWPRDRIAPFCDDALLAVLEPLHRLLPGENWVRGPEALESISFVEKQNL
jgi:hypothetical protein